MSLRRRSRALAYLVSLFVLASAVWLPTTVMGQVVPGSPFGGSGGGATAPFDDGTAIVKGSSDPTKLLRFEVDGFTTGTTRVATFPNASDTVAVLGLSGQQFTQPQVFTGGAGIGGGSLFLGAFNNANNSIHWNTSQTPDTGMLFTGSTSNSWQIAETVDQASDQNNGSCGTVACATPQVNIHPSTASTTQYNSQAYWGDAGRATKTLTESAATSAFQYSIASGAGTGGNVSFTVFATDATDHQTLTGVLQFAGVNKAGTETCATPTLTGTALNSVSSGTLTCTYAQSVTPTNACDVQFNCVSSLTQTTLEVYYRVSLVGPGQVTPQ